MSQKFNRGASKPSSVFGAVFALVLLFLVGLFIWSEKDSKDGGIIPSMHAGLSKNQVEGIVKEYIMANPGIVIEAMEKFYVEKAQQDREKTKSNLASKIKELEEDAADPRVGNGKIKIVEFFDYNCGYCRQMSEIKIRLLSNKNVQLVFKETPVLSANSLFAAKAALAVNKINKSKYFEFQSELLRHNGEINEAVIEQTVNKSGLDWNHVKKEMADKGIQEQLERNSKLAREIGVQGTPAYVVAGELISGRVSLEELQKRIESKS